MINSTFAGSDWGIDEISPYNHGYSRSPSDIFITDSMINKEISLPKKEYKYPKISKNINSSDHFSLEGMTDIKPLINVPVLTGDNLIILLLVILIITTTLIHISVKQTCETVKLLASILAKN